MSNRPPDNVRRQSDETYFLRQHKRTIRAQTLAARRALTPEQVAEKSSQIVQKLRSLPELRLGRAVLAYVSSKDNEVDTVPMIRSALESNRMLLVPVAVPSTREMIWSALKGLDELRPSTFGILEPGTEFIRPVQPEESDVAIVPGIAFDRDGYRIGYGGGYYDRFLASFRGKKIALAYELQVCESVPSEPHDVPMDIIVTEQRIMTCRRDE